MTTYLHKATKSLLGTFPEGEDKIMQLPSPPCAEICPAVNADLGKRQQEHR